MKPFLQNCISLSQSAFIPGRQIVDNVIIAHECIHHLNRLRSGKKSYMALKLDMAKAYDRVEWKFLASILKRMGFHQIFVKWIVECISTPVFSFNVQGQPSGYVIPSRGIRQGDPLSPYLFIILSEAFSNLIKQAQINSLFRGLKIGRYCPTITHLFFADDSILFCEATEQQAQIVKNIIDCYCRASGQSINIDKSSVLFSKNASLSAKTQICGLFCGIQTAPNAKYLGFPMVIGRSKRDTFNFVLESARNRICNWRNQFFNPAGKEVLIKAVFSSLPVYIMSVFQLPVSVCQVLSQVLSQLASKFWWGATENKNKRIHWAKWDKLAASKQAGGLGFRDFQDFNLSLIAKQMWRVVSEPQLLMSKIIKGRYFPLGDLASIKPHSFDSWLWRGWMNAKKVLELGMRFSVGGGKEIKIWETPWIPKFPSFLPDRVHREETGVVRVCELLDNDGKTWNEELVMELFTPNDAEIILKIPISNSGDKDRLRWHHTSRGNFTVSSAYSAFQQYKRLLKGDPGTSDDNKATKSMWKVTWKLNIKNKMKHFVWRCVHSFLPTASKLCSKGMKMDEICFACGNEVETSEHIFFHCPRAIKVWKLAPVSWNHWPTSESQFGCWWKDLCAMAKTQFFRDRISLSVYILWWLWKTRNLWRFQNVMMPEKETVKFAIKEWMEYNSVRSKDDQHLKSPGNCHTSPFLNPGAANDAGEIYIFINVQVQQTKGAGWGVVAKNTEGNTIKCWYSSRDCCGSPVEALLLAIREGQLMAYKEKWKRIVFLLEDEGLVTTLNGGQCTDLENSTTAEDILLFKNLFDCCFFQLSDSQCNLDRFN